MKRFLTANAHYLVPPLSSMQGYIPSNTLFGLPQPPTSSTLMNSIFLCNLFIVVEAVYMLSTYFLLFCHLLDFSPSGLETELKSERELKKIFVVKFLSLFCINLASRCLLEILLFVLQKESRR